MNLAARMESLAEPGHIACSQHTYELLKDDFLFSDAAEVDVKGFGPQRVYVLDGEIGARR